MAARIVTAIQLEVITPPATDSQVSASARKVLQGKLSDVFLHFSEKYLQIHLSQDFVVTSVQPISTAFQRKDVSLAIAMKVVQKDSNVMNTANVHVMIMSKEGSAIAAKKINTIDIKAA